MPQVIYQVDAFTAAAFRGNPAGVCLLPGPAEDVWMQKVAAEMNLSETAFLVRQEDGFGLRWFTPLTEVDLCGHATLASAHVLYETGVLTADEAARFFTRSGLLTAKAAGDGWIELDFPVVKADAAATPPGLAASLGAEPLYVGYNGMDYLVEVADEATVRSLRPDMGRLAAVETRGVIVTSRGSGGYDFVSRFFAPAVGIAEDPVTGSAHCALGPYWQGKLGRSELSAYQASARGGALKVTVAGERVKLAGQAVTVLRCELLV